MPASSPSLPLIHSNPVPKLPYDVHHVILSYLPLLSANSTLASTSRVSIAFYELSLPILNRHVTLSHHPLTFSLFFTHHVAALPAHAFDDVGSEEERGSRSSFTALRFPTSYTTHLSLYGPTSLEHYSSRIPDVPVIPERLFPKLDTLEIDLQRRSYLSISYILVNLPSPKHLIIRPCSIFPSSPFASPTAVEAFVPDFLFDAFTSLRTVHIVDTFLHGVVGNGDEVPPLEFPFPPDLPSLASVTWTFSPNLPGLNDESFDGFWRNNTRVLVENYLALRSLNFNFSGGLDMVGPFSAVCMPLAPLQAKFTREPTAGDGLLCTYEMDMGERLEIVAKVQLDKKGRMDYIREKKQHDEERAGQGPSTL